MGLLRCCQHGNRHTRDDLGLMAINQKAPRFLKYFWACSLTLAVAAVALTEKGSPWLPLLNTVIDLLQYHGNPGLPGAGDIPAGAGPFYLPTGQKVEPTAPPRPPRTSPDMAPAH